MPRITKEQARHAIQSATVIAHVPINNPANIMSLPQQKSANASTEIMNKEKLSSRMLRCIMAALIFVTIYVKFNLSSYSSIDEYISPTTTTLKQEQKDNEQNDNNPNKSWEERLHNLNQLPAESVHRIAFITFSYVKHDHPSKLLDFLLPAVDTWAAPTTSTTNSNGTIINEGENDASSRPPLYVVFSQFSQEPFERICHHPNISPEQLALCSRLHPIYVDCPEGKVGESPCCKQQKGLLEIFKDDYPLYDWYAFFDDDVYLRKEYLAKVLAVLQPPDFPMAAVPYNQVSAYFKDSACYWHLTLHKSEQSLCLHVFLNQDKKFIGFGNKTCGTKARLAELKEEFQYPW